MTPKTLNYSNCICGNKIVHTPKCKRYMKLDYHKIKNRESRTKKIINYLCLQCGKKIKPIKYPHCKEIIKYNRRCRKCLDKNNGKE